MLVSMVLLWEKKWKFDDVHLLGNYWLNNVNKGINILLSDYSVKKVKTLNKDIEDTDNSSLRKETDVVQLENNK